MALKANMFRHPPLACVCRKAEGQMETVELKPVSVLQGEVVSYDPGGEGQQLQNR